MSEFVAAYDIPAAEVVGAGTGGTVSREVSIPVGASRWTLFIIPMDSGALPAPLAPTFDLQYEIGGGVFYSTNPAASGTALVGKANVVTRTDVVNLVKVRLTNPVANMQDQGTLIRLFMDRG